MKDTMPCLDKYETNMKTAEVRAIFDALRRAELIPTCAKPSTGRVKLDDSIVHRAYDVEKPEGVRPLHRQSAIGYDFERGHLGDGSAFRHQLQPQ